MLNRRGEPYTARARWGILAAVALLCLVRPAPAELKPEQVGIIAMAGSRTSRDVASYYAAARQIPKSHICLLDAPLGETLDRYDWEARVRPAIQRWIIQRKLDSQLRCLVTVWDVPLKISEQSPHTQAVRERTAFLKAERENRANRVIRWIEQINRLEFGEQQIAPPDVRPDAPVKDLTDSLQQAFQEAQRRVVEKSANGQPQAEAIQPLRLMFVESGGLRAILGRSDNSADQTPAGQDSPHIQMDVVRGRLIGLQEGRLALEALPQSVARDEGILSLLERSDGVLGTLDWIDSQLQMLEQNETYASFDSELSLLFWPSYQLHRWQPNVLHHRYDGSHDRWTKTTLMVSRLEAPTVKRTAELIDTAKQVESYGLKGKLYFDARGMSHPGQQVTPGSYGDYDQSLQILAANLKTYTSADVVLNTAEELFQPGECADAALYCGWYSLGKYIDAFEWVRGSVGYHIASAEAKTLRQAGSEVWCKRMLEDGVCATMGPVYEPYLAAFPKPEEFFALLASGRYTLAECYYRTKPFNSWVMVLIGDPLYNPFKNRPLLNQESLPPSWRRLLGDVDSPQPAAP